MVQGPTALCVSWRNARESTCQCANHLRVAVPSRFVHRRTALRVFRLQGSASQVQHVANGLVAGAGCVVQGRPAVAVHGGDTRPGVQEKGADSAMAGAGRVMQRRAPVLICRQHMRAAPQEQPCEAIVPDHCRRMQRRATFLIDALDVRLLVEEEVGNLIVPERRRIVERRAADGVSRVNGERQVQQLPRLWQVATSRGVVQPQHVNGLDGKCVQADDVWWQGFRSMLTGQNRVAPNC